MPLTITFPDELATTLRTKAEPTLEKVVAKIKATPPNPAMIQYPTESLLEYLLESTPEPDPNFDIEGWDREWAKVEAELEALDPPYDPNPIPGLRRENWL